MLLNFVVLLESIWAWMCVCKILWTLSYRYAKWCSY